MVHCAAHHCKNGHRNSSKGIGITFHRFPSKEKDATRYSKWVRNIGRKNWTPSLRAVLCSAHFSAQCFDRTGQTVRLRASAVPTLFLPAHLCKKAAACHRTTAAACGVKVKMAHSCSGCLNLQLSVDGVLECPEKLWSFLADHDLVHRTVRCSVCKSDVKATGFLRFRCSKVTETLASNKLVMQQCNFDVSAHKGTFFEHSNLPLRKIVHLCYCFVLDSAMYSDVMEKVVVPLHRLIYWYAFCREVIINYCLSSSKKIGGPGKTVKITEAKVREKKYSGPSKKVQLVLGGFEKDSRSFFLIPIPDLKKETLAECIKEWILPETEIISDSWAMCSSLSFEGYTQKTVHHSTSLFNTETSAALRNTEEQLQGMHQGAKTSGCSQEQFVGHLSMAYFKLAFPNMLERFHQFLMTVAALYPPQKEKCLAQAAVPEECPPFRKKQRRKVERQDEGSGSTDDGNPFSLGPQAHTQEEKTTEASIGCVMVSVTENEEEVIPSEVEIKISDEQHVSPSTTEDPLALSPLQPAAWEEDITDAGYVHNGMSRYVESLPEEQKKQYFSKLILKKYNINLPDPYNIVDWVSNVKMWPDLNIGHIHQYLLCSQDPSAQHKSVVTTAAEGYDTFKLGNVLAVEDNRVHSDLPLFFLKAKVRPLKTTAVETYDSWVCLGEMQGTILTSHCTCLTRVWLLHCPTVLLCGNSKDITPPESRNPMVWAGLPPSLLWYPLEALVVWAGPSPNPFKYLQEALRFEEVCSHIVALLFRVEAAVSLAMNQEDLDNGSSKLAVWNKYYRPKMCVARARDINFIHPYSSKRHRELYKQFKPLPLSESEQKEALAELKKILPNAPVFMEDNSGTDTASMLDKNHQLDPTLCHHGQAALEVPVRMEGTEVPIKIEADQVPSRTETTEMPFRTEEAEMSLKMEEGGEMSLGMEFFEMPYNMEDAEVSVKSEDDVFVKMEEIEDNPYLLESG